MPRTFLRIPAIVLAALASFAAVPWAVEAADPAAAGENPLVAQLLDQGVQLADGSVVKVAAPTMPPGLDAAAQRKLIDELIKPKGYTFDRFVSGTVTAPFVLRLESLKDASGARVGQQLDIWFVATGTLDDILKGDVFSRLVGIEEEKPAEDRSSAHVLEGDELTKRNLTPGEHESYSSVDLVVLEKVRVGGVAHVLQTQPAGAIFGAALYDSAFAKDPEFPNQWRPIERDDLGRKKVGAPSPYSGFGGYAKITPLADPAGSVFIECHAVFSEPKEWFGGPNLLGSKLPLVVQDNVRNFRRELRKAGEGATAAAR